MSQRMMKAAQYDKEADRVTVTSIPIPEPTQDQLLVRIVAASLCHSDLMMDQRVNQTRPLTIGHEAIGIVCELHPSVEGCGFRVGDKVGMLSIIDSCFQCDGCRVHATFCSERSKGGPKIQGLQTDGCFAEYCVADWQSTIHLPESLPMDRMSPLFCAGITVDKCDLQSGQWLAIVGCGGVGQFAVQYARAMGLRVICLDVNDAMLSRARSKNADVVLNPQTNTAFAKEVRNVTGSRGCHAAAVFSDSLSAYATAQRVLDFNGILMVVGIPSQPLSLPAFAISTNLFRVRGASNGTAAEMKKAVDFTYKHGIVPEVVFRKLEDMPVMWEELAEGKARGKMVVLFGDNESKL